MSPVCTLARRFAKSRLHDVDMCRQFRVPLTLLTDQTQFPCLPSLFPGQTGVFEGV